MECNDLNEYFLVLNCFSLSFVLIGAFVLGFRVFYVCLEECR